MKVVRTAEQLDDLQSRCLEILDSEQGSLCPAMTYEEGIDNTIRWLRGDEDDDPLEQ